MILVLHQRHESKIHVQLHVAMKQAGAGVVCHELNLHLLPRRNGNHILQNAGGGLAGYVDQLERVAMQMNRVVVVLWLSKIKRYRRLVRTRMGSVFGYSLPLIVQ